MKIRTLRAKREMVRNWCNQYGGDTCKSGGGGSISEWAVNKLKNSYGKFSQRYGRKGAVAIMAAMAVTMPLPGNILAVIGIAEGVRAVASRLTGNASIEDILDDVRELADELGLPFDEEKFLEAYQQRMTENEARHDMPQIRKEHWQDFLTYARQHTTLTEEPAVDPHDLNAIQSEYSQERVDAIPDEKLKWPILVSRDGYVLDGNHRWIRAGQKGVTIPVLRIGLDRDDALELARSFPQAEYVENSNPEGCNQYKPCGDGYAHYSRKELIDLDEKLLGDWKQERRASDGDGLRAEIARAAVREIERQRKDIWDALSKKPYLSENQVHSNDQVVGNSTESSHYGGDTADKQPQRRRGGSSVFDPQKTWRETTSEEVRNSPDKTDFVKRLTARAKRKLARNARKPGVGPNKIDPTMTASLRRGFIAKVRAKFALIRGRLRKLVVEEDAFGLQAGNDLKMATNAFCPTGPGGGQDNSCSPMSTPSEEDTGNFLERIESGELDDSDPRVSEIGAALTDEHSKSVAKDSSGKIVAAISYRKGKFATEIRQLGSLQKGLGRTLIDRLGPGKLIAKTVRDEARGFYERLGFRPSRQNPEDMVREPTTNRYQFETSPEKIKKFQEWLRQQFRSTITGKTDEQLWREYAKQGYMKGAGRAFDDVQGPRRTRRFSPGEGDFYQGSRAEFLRSSFARPETVEKIQLLAGRSFDDLENVTEDMATRMSRTLTDGLSQGMNPREVARLLDDDLELGGNRAEVIARTEIIRAHAEGQLDSMKTMGVETVGAQVEWSTAGDGRVCPDCSEMEGKVYTIDDARGLIPMHPQCRCAWLPAGFENLYQEEG